MNTINSQYYLTFLPFIETYGWVCNNIRNSKAIFNKQAIAAFTGISERSVHRYFIYATEQGLIKFIERTRTIDDDHIVVWAMAIYEVNYPAILQAINEHYPYKPTTKDRMDLFIAYCQYTRLMYMDPESLKEHKEKNKLYRLQNTFYTDRLSHINTLRPAMLQSRYLLEGCNRETNLLCLTKNPDNDKEKQTRYNTIVTELGYNSIDNVGHWDAKSSIYRIDYALNRKELLPHNVDIYAEVWEMCNFGKPLGEYREAYKQLFMPIFMADGKKNKFWAGLTEGTIIAPKVSKKNKEAIIKLKEYLGISAYELMDKTYESLKSFLGTEHCQGGSIFVPESNTHILMQNELWDAGFKVINVYDCTYFDNSQLSSKDIQDAHDRALKEVIKRAS